MTALVSFMGSSCISTCHNLQHNFWKKWNDGCQGLFREWRNSNLAGLRRESGSHLSAFPPFLYLPDLSYFQTASSRASCVSTPDMILKGCLTCPSSLPLYTVFLSQDKSILSHHHEAFVLWKHLTLAISVNPHCHAVRYDIISCMRDGEIEAHRCEIPWPRSHGWKKAELFGCSALSGSKGWALNCKSECLPELMQASIPCLSSHLWVEKQSCW